MHFETALFAFVNICFPIGSIRGITCDVQLQSADPWSRSAEATPPLLHRAEFTVYSKCITIEPVLLLLNCKKIPQNICIYWVFCSKWHHHIITSSKLQTLSDSHSQRGRLFSGKRSLKTRSGGMTVVGTFPLWILWFFSISASRDMNYNDTTVKETKTWWVQVFCSKSRHIITSSKQQELPGSLCWGRTLFRLKCDEESVGWTGWDTFPHINAVFLSSYKTLKTRPAITLLLFGPVTSLCELKFGTSLFYLMSEGSVCRPNTIRPSHSCTVLPAYPDTHRLSLLCDYLLWRKRTICVWWPQSLKGWYWSDSLEQGEDRLFTACDKGTSKGRCIDFGSLFCASLVGA